MQKRDAIYKILFVVMALSAGFSFAHFSSLGFHILTRRLQSAAVSDIKDEEIVPVISTDTGRPTSTTLAFVGDIMLDRGVKKSIFQNGAGDYNFPFADLQAINSADILFGNLEGSVSDKGRDMGNAYSFRMSPQALQALENQSFDILSVANNHAGDWTRMAFADSIRRFASSSIVVVGGAENVSNSIEPKIIQKNGMRFGYLAFSDVGPNWLRAGTSTAGILIAGDPNTANIIRSASTKCDILVVSYHFGNEYEKLSNWRQKNLAHIAIDNGAKIVVGHHPHVVQEIENYGGGVIMYSLGNFVFDQYFSPETMSGQAVKITLEDKNITKVERFQTFQDKQFRVRIQ